MLGVLTGFGLEPGLDLVAGTGSPHEGEPVARRPALALGGQDLDDVARAQLVGQRHDLSVDLGAHATVSDVGVDLVGEVERRGARSQGLDLALGREHEHLVLEQVDLERFHELARVAQILLPVDQRSQPLEPGLRVAHARGGGRLATAAVALVDPVRGDPVFGQIVHLARPDLDLQRPALGPDDRRVQRLIHVRLRHRDEVLEPSGQRFPQRMDLAERAVAVLHRSYDHPHRGEVVDLVELPTLLGHLRVDRVEVLGPAGDLGIDPELVELLGQVLPGLVDVALALGPLLGDQSLDLPVLAGMECLEREVLELPLDRVDTEPVRDRGVDVERLARLVDLLLLGDRVDRPHVVQAVGELDQDDADVRSHRDHHLAVVLGLRLVARLEGQPGEFRDAVDETSDLVAECLLDLVQRRGRVLDGVVEQRGAQRLGVETHARADLGDPDRVDDEVLARLAQLIGMVVARVDERFLDSVAVDRHGGLFGVFLDDREQVGEHPCSTAVSSARSIVICAVCRRHEKGSDRRARAGIGGGRDPPDAAGGDSLAAAGGDSLAAAGGDSLAAADRDPVVAD